MIAAQRLIRCRGAMGLQTKRIGLFGQRGMRRNRQLVRRLGRRLKRFQLQIDKDVVGDVYNEIYTLERIR